MIYTVEDLRGLEEEAFEKWLEDRFVGSAHNDKLNSLIEVFMQEAFIAGVEFGQEREKASRDWDY